MIKIGNYDPGSNLTIINAIYHKSKKDKVTGKYGVDSLDIIYRDMNTMEKKLHHIDEPKYVYYKSDEDFSHHMMFIEHDKVTPVVCKYKDLLRSIAENVGRKQEYFDNVTSGNFRANDEFLKCNNIFNADMHIEDFYRFEFAKSYTNREYKPTKVYFDIEVDSIDMSGDFPKMGECPINAVTIVDEHNKHVYTLLLKNNNNPLIEEFMNTPNLEVELKQFVQQAVGGKKREKHFGLDEFEYSILFYDIEIELISAIFQIINAIKPDFALAWNMAFDIPYIIARIIALGYKPEDIICHPDFLVKECEYYIDKRAIKFEERGDFALISSYTVYLDQLITFASRRKGQKTGDMVSKKLDFVGDAVAGVRKLDYSHITHSIVQLPYLNYKVFVFYNVMDTIVQLCIEHETGDIDFVFSKAVVVNTRYSKVHRQTVYLANKGIFDFYKAGFIMGNNINKSNRKEGFAGAFVADPTHIRDGANIKINGRYIRVFDNLTDFDYTSLYPSIINENNMAPNTQFGKLILDEPIDPKEDKFNNDYFDRSIWFMEDLLSGDRLTFCERFMHLSNYLQMYYDILYYLTHIENPIGRLYYDDLFGKRIMCHISDKILKRNMCNIIVPKKRIMCTTHLPRPIVGGNNVNQSNSK